ncbi:hypothetical protein C1Y63_11770 [Corynebacterium sp. 13CS0277]|uniref:phosphatase PAP2 family protein n=1 Tax=Corynebacterium sp. 13CS0277 TaxID=2071994 RepID=UPI000D02D5BC|nr:phosphatase PAP2 family protein [Corynebacterium sp. 13CS0277]PRQ10369.1 hypothetical protein C1Y63_11770 [Corynebacterium sp. 13CS0277]
MSTHLFHTLGRAAAGGRAVVDNLLQRLPAGAQEAVTTAVKNFAHQPIATGPTGRLDDAVWRFVVSHRPAGSPGPTADGASPVAAGTPAPWEMPTAADAFFTTIHWVAQPGVVVTAGSLWALGQGVLAWPAIRARRTARTASDSGRPWWDWQVTPAQAAASIMMVVAAQACSTGVKKLVGRERPPEMFRLAVEHARSFPSGHMLAAVAACGTLVALRYAGRGEKIPTPLLVGMPAWCVLVGYDRLYMGVHWLSDLAGGAAIAGAWSAIAWQVHTALRAKA